MLQVTYIQKIRDQKGNIVSYILADSSGNQRSVDAYALKNAIYNGQILVDNLRLTSDGRLIDKKPDEKDSDVYGMDISSYMEYPVKQLSKLLDSVLVKNEIVSVPDNKTGGSLYGIKVWAGDRPGSFIGYPDSVIVKGNVRKGIKLRGDYRDHETKERFINNPNRVITHGIEDLFKVDIEHPEDYAVISFRLEKIKCNDGKGTMLDITAYGDVVFKDGAHGSRYVDNNVRLFNEEMDSIEDLITSIRIEKGCDDSHVIDEVIRKILPYFLNLSLIYIFGASKKYSGNINNIVLHMNLKAGKKVDNDNVAQLRGAASYNRSMDNFEEEIQHREEAAAQLQKKIHEQESIEKLQNSKSVKDIFNAFKR